MTKIKKGDVIELTLMRKPIYYNPTPSSERESKKRFLVAQDVGRNGVPEFGNERKVCASPRKKASRPC